MSPDSPSPDGHLPEGGPPPEDRPVPEAPEPRAARGGTSPGRDRSGTGPARGLRARWGRLTASPLFVWTERIVTVGIILWALGRIAPQLSAFTGIGPAVGSAPAFALETLDGDVVGSADLEGKVAVVNFWATWCAPCRLEMPALQGIHERHGDEGVVVLGISTDRGGTGEVRRVMEERGVTYPVGMATSQIRRAFGGITALPTTFIVDRAGVIRHRIFGLFAPPAMNAAVERLLEERPGEGEASPPPR